MTAAQPGTPIGTQADVSQTPDADLLRRLRWRCRRGLLENDLFIDRFFEQHGDHLTNALVQGLLQLMDLSDNDLLDLLLARKEPEGDLVNPEVKQVLSMMRVPMV
ncbi:succinate dehydrogenase assembly factor 2 [Aquabacterium lacunae]|uniref:FAD assembly factor SdhE n=1 Tax=Aquabacterium lacunae TaxID=2528630 RepID=A0A4V2JFW3_9BURK|nr:succinate dehydrogenase assembly factor 2 [Aquabacterium lacunae]TBO32876.1 succinate dehydrogenase assembly factor 2 [Aquabacterium lacunae]